MYTRNPIPISTMIILAILASMVLLFVILVLLKAEVLSAEMTWLGEKFQDKQRTIAIQPGLSSTGEVTSGSVLEPTNTRGAPMLTANENAEILSGPGVIYQILAFLEAGKSAEILAVTSDRQWWLIKVPYLNEGRGWISASKVTPQNAGTVTALEPATLVTTANVNIRSGPDLTFRVTGILAEGQIAEIVAVDPEGFWWAIRIGDSGEEIGWVAKDYVVARDTDYVPVLQAQGIERGSQQSEPFVIAKTVLNIRSGPDTQFERLGQLKLGERAKIIGKSQDGQWWAIIVPGTQNLQGWVAASFVNVENAENVPVLP